jgi:glycosyltransferase involved in cell wall biosynthesis
VTTSRATVKHSMPPRVIAVASHPIQYQIPWFRELAQEAGIDFSVLFVQRLESHQQGQGFGLAFDWDIPLLDGYRWQQVPQVRGRRGLDGFFSARIAGPLALLRRLNPDVILLTGWHTWSLVQILLAAWWAGIPVIMRGDSNALRMRPWLTRVFHRALLGKCAAFLSVGRANRDFYRSYGVDNTRIFDTPHFVDNAHFSQTAALYAPHHAGLREGWGIAGSAICFCYVGKLEPKKRVLDVLAAMRFAVAQSSKSLHLLVVGAGELLPQAQAFAHEHHLPVTFTGFLNQTEIPSAYAATDCLILASDYGETWGLVVNEAMACGRPALVSDRIGCAADLINEGVTGSIFPFADIRALAALMLRLANEPTSLAIMGERAREHVLKGYSVRNSVVGTMLAIDYVLTTEPTPTVSTSPI